MIKTIIFDFGDVFINLDKVTAKQNALKLFKTDSFSEEMIATNNLYEQGLISTASFIKFYKYISTNITDEEIKYTWNFIIKDFPTHRLEFIKTLSEEKKFRLILLSNTNELHINYVKDHIEFYEDFKNCFDAFYLSHEINLRKPNPEIFEFVLEQNNLLAKECLFIDDTKEHIKAASLLGMHVWNINPKAEDVTQLFKIKENSLK
jgi:glucose-1-phosphatase